jgi:hypothetical protein
MLVQGNIQRASAHVEALCLAVLLATAVACAGAGCSSPGARAADSGRDAPPIDTANGAEAADAGDAMTAADTSAAADTHADFSDSAPTAGDTSADSSDSAATPADAHAETSDSAATAGDTPAESGDSAASAGDILADSSDSAATATDGGLLSCSSTGPVEPVVPVATYARWTSYCGGFEAPCKTPGLLQHLLTCDATLFTFHGGYGTQTVRVAERRAATCVLHFWEDFEGCATYKVCEVPLPLSPWSGLTAPFTLFQGAILSGISQYCTTVESCSVASSFCSLPACGASPSVPPVCTNTI